MGYAEHFTIANIPYGIGSSSSHPQPLPVTRLGDLVFFLAELNLNCSPDVQEALTKPTLNALAALPKSLLTTLRTSIQTALSDPSAITKHGIPLDQVQLHLPVQISGFTDFSCSKEHLTNMGQIMGGTDGSLPPASLHFPIGYGARASSVVVSGTPIKRPVGQFWDREKKVVFGASRSMDYELEMACVVGRPSRLGDAVDVGDADEHIFGLVLLNDWSARDLQRIEMDPLGPNQGKSFGTTISPWIITLDALAAFSAPAPPKDFAPAAYLQDPKPEPSYDITLRVEIVRDGVVSPKCTSRVRWMYWTFRDLVAQQTCNGCNLATGDLLATGTVSGSGDDEHGCLAELTWGGRNAHVSSDGKEMMWLEDGDEVRIVGWAGDGKAVGFGECSGVLIPARVV